MKKLNFFNSIKSRLVLALLCIILFLLCFTLGLNVIYLPSFYEKIQIWNILNIYENIKTNRYDNLDKICTDNNLTIYRFDVSEDETEIFLTYPQYLPDNQLEIVKDLINEYYINEKTDVISIIEKTKTYIICKMLDPIMNSTYIDLFSRYDNQIMYIRLNLESIQDLLDISNIFLLGVSLLTMIEGSLAMIVLSSYFIDPILKLVKIANNISELNFESKYEDNRDDEIEILGQSINKLSNNLQRTISELELSKNDLAIANKQLELDLKEKEEIDEMRKSFISDVSHELKTPLALIQGYTEGLQYAIEDEESRKFYCDTIIEETEKLNNLVKKLTALTKIEYGYQEVNLTTFSIKDILDNKLQTMNILFKNKEIIIESNIKDCLVKSDEFLLDEILNNYLSNAINHINEQKIIKIWNEISDDYVTIFVYNSGIPISDKEMEKLWIKFYKVDKARTREYGGSGIGLSIVKAIQTTLNQEHGCYAEKDGMVFWCNIKRA